MGHTQHPQQQIQQQQVVLYAKELVAIQRPLTVSIQKNKIYFLKLNPELTEWEIQTLTRGYLKKNNNR